MMHFKPCRKLKNYELSRVKPNLVDDNWEEWSMEDLIEAPVRTEDRRQAEAILPFVPNTWSLKCELYQSNCIGGLEEVLHLGFNCRCSNHRADQCLTHGRVKCKYRHHTSICDRQERRNSSSPNTASLTGYTKYLEKRVLPTIVPVSIKGQVQLLKLNQIGHEMPKILTVNGTKVRSMPIFDSHIRSLDGRSSEKI